MKLSSSVSSTDAWRLQTRTITVAIFGGTSNGPGQTYLVLNETGAFVTPAREPRLCRERLQAGDGAGSAFPAGAVPGGTLPIPSPLNIPGLHHLGQVQNKRKRMI